ncbi:MAG: T9SS type A sorting domain-containing protein [Flavobacteriales bacterium]|nr:T9SS type A sorting domain-containing protein [Flavobacteriales bacterium]
MYYYDALGIEGLLNCIDDKGTALVQNGDELNYFVDDQIVKLEAAAGAIAYLGISNFEMDQTTIEAEISQMPCIDITTNNESNRVNDASVYPSPTTGVVNVFGNYRTNYIEVLDVLGQVITTSFSSMSIDLKGNTSGVYFLKIHTEAGMISKKVFLE